jgi:hypothetical protein
MSVATKSRWLASMLAGGVCFAAGAALSQAAAFPVALTTFQANTPAVAAQVNANFAALRSAVETLKTSVEAKIGPITSVGSSLNVNGATGMTGNLNVGGTSYLAGTNVNGNLNVLGPTNLEGRTVVTGDLLVTGNIQGPRYIVDAPFNAAYSGQDLASSATAVDMTKLRALCSDGDGCLVRLIMKDYVGSKTDASVGPLHFEYDTSTNSFRAAELQVGTAFQSINNLDGDGQNTHALRAWNCYFTDSSYVVGGTAWNDSAVGMYLLNYNGETVYRPNCQLIIDD